MQEFKDSKGKTVLYFKSHLGELDWQRFTEIHGKYMEEDLLIHEKNALLEEFNMLVEFGETDNIPAEKVDQFTQDELEDQITELNLKRDYLIRDQLLLICRRQDRKRVKDLSPYERMLISAKIVLDFDEWQVGATIKIPGGNDLQIKELTEHIATLHKQHHAAEIHELKTRIAGLKKHEFVLEPVQKAIFAVRMSTDLVRDGFTKVPEVIAKRMEETGATLAEIMEEFNIPLEQLDSLEERKAQLERRREFKKFQTLTDDEMIQRAHEILTHLLVPVGEEYRYRYAVERKDKIKKVAADKVMAMLSFISAVLDNWRTSIASSSQTPNPEKILTLLSRKESIFQRLGSGRQFSLKS